MVELTRRNALTTFATAGLAAAGACARSEETTADQPARSAAQLSTAPNRTPLPGLPKSLLVNRARAQRLMLEAGVDAIICARPENIYYLTNHYPQLMKMGMENLAYAILPRDPMEAPILVIGEFSFYLSTTERATPDLVDARLFTSPAEPEAFASASASDGYAARADAAAQPSYLPQTHSEHAPSAIESNRVVATAKANQDMAATAESALLRAVRDLALAGKRVAVDDEMLAVILERAELPIVQRDAERLLRSIRLQKSSAEITLAKYAARENAAAALAAARLVADGATFQDVRVEFARQCADRLLTPSFMAIDGVIPDTAPGTIEEGRAFLIDCVSDHQNYYGDYGRTVCVGEPTAEIAKATSAISTLWDELLPELKPGMRYSEIGAKAQDIYSRLGADFNLICNPHSVGLHHTDEPGLAGFEQFVKDDLEIVEGMVLSIDLPVLEVGLGGSAHLEDLVLIGASGAELLNDPGDRVIII